MDLLCVARYLIGLEVKNERYHASSPSTSGKTYEKTSVIHTRPEQFDVLISSSRPVHHLSLVGQSVFFLECKELFI